MMRDECTYVLNHCVLCCMLLLTYFCAAKLSKSKQPSCKKKSVAPKKARVKKDVKSKVATKKWQVNGKKFNNDNSAEFALPPPCFTRIRHQIYLNCRY